MASLVLVAELLTPGDTSATRATIHKRICVCESPRDKLTHKQNSMSKLEVSEFCRAFEVLDWGDGAV